MRLLFGSEVKKSYLNVKTCYLTISEPSPSPGTRYPSSNTLTNGPIGQSSPYLGRRNLNFDREDHVYYNQTAPNRTYLNNWPWTQRQWLYQCSWWVEGQVLIVALELWVVTVLTCSEWWRSECMTVPWDGAQVWGAILDSCSSQD